MTFICMICRDRLVNASTADKDTIEVGCARCSNELTDLRLVFNHLSRVMRVYMKESADATV